MPFKKDPASLLADILADIDRIRAFTLGMSFAEFEANEAINYSVKYALLRISEASHRLGNEADNLYPNIPWRDIRGLGNRLRHAYDSIDAELIWVIVERDLDLLETAIRKVLK